MIETIQKLEKAKGEIAKLKSLIDLIGDGAAKKYAKAMDEDSRSMGKTNRQSPWAAALGQIRGTPGDIGNLSRKIDSALRTLQEAERRRVLEQEKDE